MGNINYTAQVGVKLLGTEAGAWLTELTAGNASGAGVSNDLSATGIDLDATGTVVKSAVETDADLMGWGSFSTSNYLSRAHGADLDTASGEACTICGWIKTSDISGVQGVIGNLSRGASGDRGGIGFRIVSSTLEWVTSDGAGILSAARDTVDLETDNWIFIAGTLSASGEMVLYKNGVQVGSETGGDIDATAELFKIGVEVSSGAIANPFKGRVSIVKFYNAVLTQAQLKLIYQAERDLFFAYSPYTIIGTSYDLAVSLNQATLSERVESSRPISIGGQQETVFGRRDTFYSLRIIRLTLADLPTLRRFIHSVERGQTFSLDRYGSAAVPDDPVNAIMTPGYSEPRNGVDDYYTSQINVREVP